MPNHSRRKSRPTAPPFSPKQKQLLAEILGNIGVAWFTVGVISPLFLGIFSLKTVFSVSVGIILTLLFIAVALMIVKERKSR